MRVLFFGTSPFALPTLQALHDSGSRHAVLAVVTQPDRPHGRGLRLQGSPVKELALALGYPLHQPEKVRRAPFPELVREMKPDVLVVISFGQIIPQKILDIPRFGGINVHASLLPRWRGAAPIHRAIIAGDSETGVATMQMEATLDTGPTFLMAREPIRPADTVATLEPRLAASGAALLLQTLDRLESGNLHAETQSSEGMTYAAPVTRADGLLDPLIQTADAMERRVRGASPRPGAFLALGGRTVRVLAAESRPWPMDAPETTVPGTIISIGREGITVAAAARTAFLISRLQPENRGAMAPADWVRGARLEPADRATVVAT